MGKISKHSTGYVMSAGNNGRMSLLIRSLWALICEGPDVFGDVTGCMGTGSNELFPKHRSTSSVGQKLIGTSCEEE